MFVIGGLVEMLQRFHALVSRARRRIAMVQNRLQQVFAFWIVSAQRKRIFICDLFGVKSVVIGY